MNKRADKILSIYWFAILIITAGGIFIMVYLFYGMPYDIREIESNLLINKIADCTSYAGKINTDLISNGKISDDNQTFLDNQCNLIFSSDEPEEQYYTEVNIYKLENLNAPILDIKKGNNKWLSSCVLQQNKKQERLAQCVEKKFYSLDNSNNQYIIKILAVVRKTEKNVQL